MAWSPLRRSNAGINRVANPGDYATPHSNHLRDGTSLDMLITLPPGTTQIRLHTGQSDAQPVETAPKVPDTSLLLFCPEQGGWHVGQWWTADGCRWVAMIDAERTLEPTHWAPAPIDPE